MKHLKYPSISVYGTAIKSIIHHLRYIGKDVNGDAIYDNNKILPIISFTGTVKIHGTNAGVCYDIKTGNIWSQSRESIITVDNDNAGFAKYIEKNKEIFKELFEIFAEAYEHTKGVVSIYGEWCGKGIQSGCGIHQVEKLFVVFGFKITKKVDDVDGLEMPDISEWVNVDWVDLYAQKYRDIRMYHINCFGKYNINIDLNEPKLSQNELIDITNEVERECPVAKKLGAIIENGSMVGEGVVWVARINGKVFRFKVKGDKHSSSKVKSLAPVDVEKMASIVEFVDYAVTDNRLEQGIQEVFVVNNIIPDIKLTGSFLKWIVTDVMKEEHEVLSESGLVTKDVTNAISNKGRKWFFKNYIEVF